MTIFQDKRLTGTYCDEAGDYDVLYVVSPKDIVSRPDLSDINCTATTRVSNSLDPDHEGNQLSLVVRTPVFGVSDHAPHKPGCTTTQDG